MTDKLGAVDPAEFKFMLRQSMQESASSSADYAGSFDDTGRTKLAKKKWNRPSSGPDSQQTVDDEVLMRQVNDVDNTRVAHGVSEAGATGRTKVKGPGPGGSRFRPQKPEERFGRVDEWIGGSPTKQKRSWKVKSKKTPQKGEAPSSPTKDGTTPASIGSSPSSVSPRRWQPPPKSERNASPFLTSEESPKRASTTSKWKSGRKSSGSTPSSPSKTNLIPPKSTAATNKTKNWSSMSELSLGGESESSNVSQDRLKKLSSSVGSMKLDSPDKSSSPIQKKSPIISKTGIRPTDLFRSASPRSKSKEEKDLPMIPNPPALSNSKPNLEVDDDGSDDSTSVELSSDSEAADSDDEEDPGPTILKVVPPKSKKPPSTVEIDDKPDPEEYKAMMRQARQQDTGDTPDYVGSSENTGRTKFKKKTWSKPGSPDNDAEQKPDPEEVLQMRRVNDVDNARIGHGVSEVGATGRVKVVAESKAKYKPKKPEDRFGLVDEWIGGNPEPKKKSYKVKKEGSSKREGKGKASQQKPKSKSKEKEEAPIKELSESKIVDVVPSSTNTSIVSEEETEMTKGSSALSIEMEYDEEEIATTDESALEEETVDESLVSVEQEKAESAAKVESSDEESALEEASTDGESEVERDSSDEESAIEMASSDDDDDELDVSAVPTPVSSSVVPASRSTSKAETDEEEGVLYRPDPNEYIQMRKVNDHDNSRVDHGVSDSGNTGRTKIDKKRWTPKKPDAGSNASRVEDWVGPGQLTAKKSWTAK